MFSFFSEGKWFKQLGIDDLLSEASVVASGSMNGVMSGHCYNRALRAHKLFAESLERLRWEAFSDRLSYLKVKLKSSNSFNLYLFYFGWGGGSRVHVGFYD